MGMYVHTELLSERSEDRREVVHARVPLFGKHAVEALGGPRDLDRQPFEANGRIDEIAQEEPGQLWLAVEEMCRRLVEQRLGKIGIVPHSFYDRLLKSRVSRISFTFCV